MHVISTVLYPSKRSPQEIIDNRGIPGPTLRDGNFIWSEVEETLDNQGSFDETYTTKSVRICTSKEFFNKATMKCESCGENKGTTAFQQTSCKSCGDIWYDSQEDPSSMEAIIAKQLCADPEQVYADEEVVREAARIKAAEEAEK